MVLKNSQYITVPIVSQNIAIYHIVVLCIVLYRFIVVLWYGFLSTNTPRQRTISPQTASGPGLRTWADSRQWWISAAECLRSPLETWAAPAWREETRTQKTSIKKKTPGLGLDEECRDSVPSGFRQRSARTWRLSSRSRSDAATTAVLSTDDRWRRSSQTGGVRWQNRRSRAWSLRSLRSRVPSWLQSWTEPGSKTESDVISPQQLLMWWVKNKAAGERGGRALRLSGSSERPA